MYAYNAGLNFGRKNDIRKLRSDGLTIDDICAITNCAPHLVMAYLETVAKEKIPLVAGPRGERNTDLDDEFKKRLAKDNIAEIAAPVQDASESDELGPLPGSAAWGQLAPGRKSVLTRHRNQRELAVIEGDQVPLGATQEG